MVLKKQNLAIAAGFVLVFLIYVGQIILGDNAIVQIHDQLDGEIFTYILRAQNGVVESFPQFMNNMPATSLQMASVGTLIFYILFSPATAFFVNMLFVALCAYLGMYFLLKMWQIPKWVCGFCAVMFAVLPFYSVYGLSVMGVPIAWAGFWGLCNAKSLKSYVLSLLTIAFYALFSSLVLVGFAVLIAALMATVFFAVKKMWQQFRAMLIGGAVLGGIYAVCNTALIGQIFFGMGEVSHKEELVLSATPFSIKTVVSFFVGGQYHAEANHKWIVVFCAVALIAFVIIFKFLKIKGDSETEIIAQKCFTYILFFLGICLAIAFVYAAFSTPFVCQIRNNLGSGLKSFQFDRIYWLYPTLWHVILALSITLALQINKALGFKIVGILAICLLLLTIAFATKSYVKWLDSLPIANWKHLITQAKANEDYNYITWNGYFANDLFEQAQADIERNGDTDKSQYTVISIGMSPTVALYNGFYCLDGYSNNYSLEYKAQFRKIIENELDKDDKYIKYFDEWGNRCYAFVSGIDMAGYGKSSSLTITDLKFNLTAFEQMNGKYIFSALQIENPHKLGLELVNTYESDTSFYKLYLYKIA